MGTKPKPYKPLDPDFVNQFRGVPLQFVEIAKIMDMHPTTVRNLFKRAIRTLRIKMDESGNNETVWRQNHDF